MAKKRKEFLATLKLTYDYVDDEETIGYSQYDVRWEMISWLEDLGFSIDYVDVVEDRGGAS